MKFLEVYQTKEVTPYIHMVICHVGEFMRIHGCLISFTQQGLEKYNDTMTKDYFRSSSHKGEQALTQIMQKQNRLEYFNDRDVKRPKHHDIQYSNCGISGHNKLSCVLHALTVTTRPLNHILLVLMGERFLLVKKKTNHLQLHAFSVSHPLILFGKKNLVSFFLYLYMYFFIIIMQHLQYII